jgi:hypothetical protein
MCADRRLDTVVTPCRFNTCNHNSQNPLVCVGDREQDDVLQVPICMCIYNVPIRILGATQCARSIVGAMSRTSSPCDCGCATCD